MTEDTLGDRMKTYEQIEASRKAMPLLPVMARLDGKAFHTYTRGLKRPYDENLSKIMVETTRYLVDETHARIGYTQSDEISLVFLGDPANSKSAIMFDGKYQKLVSVLAAMATAKFNSLVPDLLPTKKDSLAVFDCRVWQVPNLEEAANTFLWRELDATKNSIAMAAQSVYSHKELQSKNQSEMQEMLFQKGINWNDYPTFFKRGTWLRRQTIEVVLSDEERLAIPEKFRPDAGTKVKRTKILEIEMPPFNKVTNRAAVIFNSHNPLISAS